MGRIELRVRDLRAPRDVAGACQEETEREHCERKRRGIEDVRAPPIPVPADELLGREAESHHQELQVEPVWLEPQKQVDAEDDRERTEAEHIRVSPRPAEQHVQGIGEHQLPGDEMGRGIHWRPVPTPIHEYRELGAGLQIVLFSRLYRQRQRSARALRQQDRVPRKQCRRRAPEGPRHVRVLSDRGEQSKGGQTQRDGKRQAECT